jgi:hypothetical protein
LEVHELQTYLTQLPIDDSSTKASTDVGQDDPEDNNKQGNWFTKAERENIRSNALC